MATTKETIESIKANIQSAYATAQNKGATIPAKKNLANLSSTIDSIQTQGTMQEKTAIPTTSEQVVTADSNYDGLSKVTISGVTSAIDSNIVAGNIKKNVTILGVTGNYGGSTGEVTYEAQLVDAYMNDDNKLVLNDWDGTLKDTTVWMISEYRLGTRVKLAFQDFYNLRLDGVEEEN